MLKLNVIRTAAASGTLWFVVHGAAAVQTPVETHGRLRVEGTKIVGQHGEPVTLRGMSLFWSQWGGHYFTPQTVRWLVDDWNVNIIRAPLAVHHGGYMQNPDAEWAKVKTVIDAAIEEGIYVVVDWHAHEPEPDAAAAFTRELGLDFDGSGAGLGTRCKRFSLTAEDGVVKNIEVEEKPSDLSVSSADSCLARLGQ